MEGDGLESYEARSFAIPADDVRPPGERANILSVGVALPDNVYTQEEIADRLGITNPRLRQIFTHGGIQQRHLSLAPSVAVGTESQGSLLERHKNCALLLAKQALRRCLDDIGARLSDIDHLCCVTTTGFVSPGLSAHLIRHLPLRDDCSRLDVVGMGCNAGLNALAAVSGWAQANPMKLAVMVCVEIASAMYVADSETENLVVNSLFGDGAAAVAVCSRRRTSGPRLLRFSSLLIPDTIDAMRVDWSDMHGKFRFRLDRDVPYVIGRNVVKSVNALISPMQLRISDISHWVFHSGGKKVIDAARLALGLSASDLRHTLSVLRDCGNLSSSSFLHSYRRLLDENAFSVGDFAVMVTMGPGSTIEAALLQW